MKVSEAEKLICPFMSETKLINDGLGGSYSELTSCNCITTKCMAWKVTLTKIDMGAERSEEVKRIYIAKEDKNGDNVTDLAWSKYPDEDLSPQDCEGYCIRLKE